MIIPTEVIEFVTSPADMARAIKALDPFCANPAFTGFRGNNRALKTVARHVRKLRDVAPESTGDYNLYTVTDDVMLDWWESVDDCSVWTPFFIPSTEAR